MSKHIQNPHDKFFRTAMSDLRVARDFFDFHLPPTIKEVVQLDQLTLCKESFVDENLKLTITDILFSVQFADQPGYLYTLVEHQSKPEKQMPLRILKYMINIIEQHLKNNPQSPLPLVYPLLFYTGSTDYSYSTDIFDLFDGPKDLAKQIFLQPFQLVEVSKMSDEVLKQHMWLGIMELCMKHIRGQDILVLCKNMLFLLQGAEEAEGKHYVQAALTYLWHTAEIKDNEKFIQLVREGLSHETEEKIMTLAEYFEQKGEAKGRVEGLAEGEIKEKKRFAKKLFESGMTLKDIYQMTELSTEDLEKFLHEKNVS